MILQSVSKDRLTLHVKKLINKHVNDDIHYCIMIKFWYYVLCYDFVCK